jgi:drug/metabolite transporter (DMT)-like permease
MSLVAILLLIVSAVLHATWNLISKSNKPSAAFLLVANAFGSLLLIPVAIYYGANYASFSTHVWILVAATGVFQALYFASLAGAYKSGDMSLAYPLARSSPIIVVAAVTFILGQGETISMQCVAGILLVVAGCFLVPMKTFRDFRLSNYFCRTCGFALMAAIGTAGYSIIDSEALGSLKRDLGGSENIIILTILYALTESISTGFFLLLYVSSRKTERNELKSVIKSKIGMACITGVAIYLTYTLVLISMSWARNVSYVVGFRQLSIPIGVMMGAMFLKEPLARPKIAGVTILVAGLILIALG